MASLRARVLAGLPLHGRNLFPRQVPRLRELVLSYLDALTGLGQEPHQRPVRLLGERIVFLGSAVDDDVANRITAQLLLLAAEDSKQDITFYINSPGGSVTAGMAIYDTMQLIEPDVSTWAVGFAASMGQFLLSAGTRGKRYALPHCQILMHQPSAGVGGTESDIAIQAELFRRHNLVGHGLHHVGTGDEHVAGVAHHEDEVGHRGRIDIAARARAHDD